MQPVVLLLWSLLLAQRGGAPSAAVGPDAAYTLAQPGATIAGTNLRVQGAVAEAGTFRVTFENTGAAGAVNLTARFFDGKGREILHGYSAVVVDVPSRARRDVNVAAPDRTATRLGFARHVGPAQQAWVVQASRLTLTRDQFERMQVNAYADATPIGWGDPNSPLPKGIGWYEPKSGRLKYAVEIVLGTRSSRSKAVTLLSKGVGAQASTVWLDAPIDSPAIGQGVRVCATTPAGNKVVAPTRALISGLSAFGVCDIQSMPRESIVDAIEIGDRRIPAELDATSGLCTPEIEVVTTPGTSGAAGTARFTHVGGPPALVRATSPDGTFSGGAKQVDFTIAPHQTVTQQVRADSLAQPMANVGWSARPVETNGVVLPIAEGPILGGTVDEACEFSAGPTEAIQTLGSPPTLDGVPVASATSAGSVGSSALYAVPLVAIASQVFKQEKRVNDRSYAVVPTQVPPTVTDGLYQPQENTELYAVNATRVAGLDAFFSPPGGAFLCGNVQANRLDPNDVKVDKWDWEIDWDSTSGRDGWTFHHFCDWGPLGSAPWHYYAVFDKASGNVATGKCDEVWGYDKKSRRDCRQEFKFETETRGALWWSQTITVVYIVKICKIDWCKWKLCKYRRAGAIVDSYKWVVESKECTTVEITVAKKKIAEYPQGTEIDWVELGKKLLGK